MDESNKLIIFTDGASRGNPGPGGYGAILVFEKLDEVVELGGAKERTTNNEMELSAVVAALSYAVMNTVPTHIYTDSKYVMQGATSWIHGWKRNGWKKKDGEEILNKELWQQLEVLLSERLYKTTVQWHHLPGHSGIPGNERADQIASRLADGIDVDLFRGRFDTYPLKKEILSLPTEKELETMRERRSEKKSSSSKKAYCYLSLLNGVVKSHKTWAECEKRVKGQSYVKFKKAFSADHARDIQINEWGIKEADAISC